MCERFHKLPSEVLAEDASLLQMMALVKLGTPDEEVPG